MTSPDGASPSGASGYANVGDLQDVTQETVDGLYRTRSRTRSPPSRATP